MRIGFVALLALATALPAAAADHHGQHFEGRQDIGPLIEYCEWDVDARDPELPSVRPIGTPYVYCQPQA